MFFTTCFLLIGYLGSIEWPSFFFLSVRVGSSCSYQVLCSFLCPALVCSIWYAFHLFCIGTLLSIDRPPQWLNLAPKPLPLCLSYMDCLLLCCNTSWLSVPEFPNAVPCDPLLERPVAHLHAGLACVFLIFSPGSLPISYILVFGFGQHQISVTVEYLIDN